MEEDSHHARQAGAPLEVVEGGLDTGEEEGGGAGEGEGMAQGLELDDVPQRCGGAVQLDPGHLQGGGRTETGLGGGR